MKFKPQLIGACENYVEERILKINYAIAELETALKLETKCSMGDKYETGRAMLHLEFEKLALQMEQYKQLKKTLSFVKDQPSSTTIGFGSVVKTNKTHYFLSIPAGPIIIDSNNYYAIGINSPIAQALVGKKQGETLTFNGITSIIEFVE